MNDVLEKTKGYWKAAGRTGLAHYRAAEVAEKWNRMVGVPNTVISAIVATSIFATLSENVDIRLRIATGFVAIAAAILAALQAFLNLADRAEKHKLAGAKYGGVRRQIDLFELSTLDVGSDDRQAALERLGEITEALNSLATESPTLNSKLYDEAKREFDTNHNIESK